MQYVFRYINHKHGIKTARGICRAGVFSCDILGESVEEKSNSDALWKSRDGYFFLSVDLTLNAADLDLWYGRTAGLAGDAYPLKVPFLIFARWRGATLRRVYRSRKTYARYQAFCENTSSITRNVLNIDRSPSGSCRLSGKTSSSSGLLTRSRVDRS